MGIIAVFGRIIYFLSLYNYSTYIGFIIILLDFLNRMSIIVVESIKDLGNDKRIKTTNQKSHEPQRYARKPLPRSSRCCRRGSSFERVER